MLVRHWFKRTSQLPLAAGVVAMWTGEGVATGRPARNPIATVLNSETASRRLAGDLNAVLASAPKACLDKAHTLSPTAKGPAILPSDPLCSSCDTFVACLTYLHVTCVIELPKSFVALKLGSDFGSA